MDPVTWKDMVINTRELESALGDGDKIVQQNEQDTVVVQRRCLRAAKNISQGELVTSDMVDVLRPAPPDAIFPYQLDQVLGRKSRVAIDEGEYFTWDKLE